MNLGSWTPEQEAFLKKSIGKLTIEQIGMHLGKSALAVKLYMHRHRMSVGPKVKRNILQELLRMKFGDPRYFQPTREFYRDIGITQRRWWDLFHGRKQITRDEYLRVAKNFNLTIEEAFESRQLKLFEEP